MCKKPAFEGINKSNYSFYNSREWRKAAKLHKAKNPLCVKCKEEDIIKAVEITDHIIPVDKGGNKWADSNLQSLCHSHHNKKSGRSK